jgi:hypothetical protein
MLKKLIKGARELVEDVMPGDSEKYLGTIVGLATGNPLLAAGAGYLGGGTSGAISGGLSGLMSPGLKGFGAGFGSVGGEGIMSTLTGGGKEAAGNLGQLFLGQQGFDVPTGAQGPGRPEVKGILGTGGFGEGLGKLDKLGLGALGIFTLGQSVPEEKDEEITKPEMVTTTRTLGGDDQFAYSRPEIFYPSGPQKRGELTYDYGTIPYYAAAGGTPEFPRENGIGAIEGPGTETSDSIPAMLSDGEFVMNANAVKGAGYAAGAQDDYEARKLGAQKMYETMDQLEAVA